MQIAQRRVAPYSCILLTDTNTPFHYISLNFFAFCNPPTIILTKKLQKRKIRANLTKPQSAIIFARIVSVYLIIYCTKLLYDIDSNALISLFHNTHNLYFLKEGVRSIGIEYFVASHYGNKVFSFA